MEALPRSTAVVVEAVPVFIEKVNPEYLFIVYGFTLNCNSKADYIQSCISTCNIYCKLVSLVFVGFIVFIYVAWCDGQVVC